MQSLTGSQAGLGSLGRAGIAAEIGRRVFKGAYFTGPCTVGGSGGLGAGQVAGGSVGV